VDVKQCGPNELSDHLIEKKQDGANNDRNGSGLLSKERSLQKEDQGNEVAVTRALPAMGKGKEGRNFDRFGANQREKITDSPRRSCRPGG